MFRHEVEKITPEIAKIYYSRSTGNRVINRQAVKTYIAQMKTGRWVLNGETICFDSNGVLRDGHHRLLATIESGVTIEVLVVRGVDPAAFLMLYKGCTKECVGRFWEGFALGILPAYKQARTALSVASGSKAVMQIVYSAWYAYEHDNITEDFVMIEGSFV